MHLSYTFENTSNLTLYTSRVKLLTMNFVTIKWFEFRIKSDFCTNQCGIIEIFRSGKVIGNVPLRISAVATKTKWNRIYRSQLTFYRFTWNQHLFKQLNLTFKRKLMFLILTRITKSNSNRFFELTKTDSVIVAVINVRVQTNYQPFSLL